MTSATTQTGAGVDAGGKMSVPTAVPVMVAIASGAVALSSVLGLAAAAMLGRIVQGASPAWTMVGFEVIGILTGVMGLLFAMGRFREAPGMALACIAGTIFSVAVCTHLSVQGRLGPHSLAILTQARIGAAAVVAVLAAVCVLSRNPRSYSRLLKGVLLGAPTLIVGGALLATRGQISDDVMKSLETLGSVWRFVILSVGALVVGGTLCASVEFVVRAFQMGEVSDSARDAAETAPKTSAAG